jgi:hypothetical protein
MSGFQKAFKGYKTGRASQGNNKKEGIFWHKMGLYYSKKKFTFIYFLGPA